MKPTSYNILSEHTLPDRTTPLNINVIIGKSRKDHKRPKELDTITPLIKKSPKVLTRESYEQAMKDFQELRLRLSNNNKK